MEADLYVTLHSSTNGIYLNIIKFSVDFIISLRNFFIFAEKMEKEYIIEFEVEYCKDLRER